MKAPTVHLNGTDGEQLLQAAINAKDAVETARDALRKVYPNGRDYYPQDQGGAGVAHRVAVDQYLDMDKKLLSVETELQELAFEISQQQR